MTSFNQGNTATICSGLLTSGFFPHQTHSPSLRTSHYCRDLHFPHGEAHNLVLTTLEEFALESMSFKATLLEHKPLQVLWGQGWAAQGQLTGQLSVCLGELSPVVSAKSSHIPVLASVSWLNNCKFHYTKPWQGSSLERAFQSTPPQSARAVLLTARGKLANH